MSDFARRHYEAIATLMQDTKPLKDATAFTQWYVDCEGLADMLADDNARFDRERFIRACEPGANVRARS